MAEKKIPEKKQVEQLKTEREKRNIIRRVYLDPSTPSNWTVVRVVFGRCLTSTPGVYADTTHLRDAITTCTQQGSAADEQAAYARLASFVATQ